MNDSIMDLMTAPWRMHVVFAAVRLNLFSVLSDKSMTAGEIASRCGADLRILQFLLDALVSMEFLTVSKDSYSNAGFSRRYLVAGEPRYIGDLVKLQHIESSRWDRLYELLSKDEKAAADENEHSTFIKAMDNLGNVDEAESLCNATDLSDCTRMVDAGGGSGLYSVVLCKKYPQLHSTIVDKIETLAVTRELIAGCEERKRISLREGDLESDPLGQDIDVVLLSDVIYEEASAGPILNNVHNSLTKNGLLIVRGYYSDPEGSRPLFGALFVLNELVFDPERAVMTLSSLQEKLIEYGFTIETSSPLTERSFIIISRKG